MIAILLYLIGLISALVTVVLVGFDAPAIYYSILTAYNSGLNNVVPALARAAVELNWALVPGPPASLVASANCGWVGRRELRRAVCRERLRALVSGNRRYSTNTRHRSRAPADPASLNAAVRRPGRSGPSRRQLFLS